MKWLKCILMCKIRLTLAYTGIDLFRSVWAIYTNIPFLSYYIYRPNKKRQSRNLKFGFGGQKKRSKYNTADSSGDLTGYSVKKHGLRPGKKIGAPKVSTLKKFREIEIMI